MGSFSGNIIHKAPGTPNPLLAMSTTTPSKSPHLVREQEKKELQFLNSKLENYGEQPNLEARAGTRWAVEWQRRSVFPLCCFDLMPALSHANLAHYR